ncbi:MAG: hypothetical protein ACXVHY_11225, partial [Methanobacterium sp.]
MGNVRLNNTKNTFLIILLIYSLLRIPYFLINGYVPDERMFILKMKEITLLDFTNYYAYGTIFWKFGNLLIKIFHSKIAIILMRILAFLSFLISASYIYSIAKEKNYKYANIILIAFLTLPFMWWGGKLITPEIYTLPIICYCLYNFLLRKGKEKISWFLLGIAFGLKMTNIFVIFFIIIFDFLKKIEMKKKFLTYEIRNFFLLSIGFIVTNPSFIYDNNEFLKNLNTVSHFGEFKFDIESLKNIFFSKLICWDIVECGGIHYNIIPVISIILSFICLLLSSRSWKLFFNNIITFLFIIFMIIKNQLFAPWYLFTWPIIIFASISVGNYKNNIIFLIIMISIIISNCFITITNVIRDYHLRYNLAQNLSDRGIYTDCFKNLIKEDKDIDFIIDQSETGYTYSLASRIIV